MPVSHLLKAGISGVSRRSRFYPVLEKSGSCLLTEGSLCDRLDMELVWSESRSEDLGREGCRIGRLRGRNCQCLAAPGNGAPLNRQELVLDLKIRARKNKPNQEERLW